MILSEKLFRSQLKNWPVSQIKKAMGRERLKLSLESIGFYLMALAEAQERAIHLSQVYRERVAAGRYAMTYANFMAQVQSTAGLFEALFSQFNSAFKVNPSTNFNIIDSTLLTRKEAASITQKDWQKGEVTCRKKGTGKAGKPSPTLHLCGYKGLVVINSKAQVTHGELLRINESDFNLLKSPLALMAKGVLQGTLLADRGFNCKAVRQRFANIANDPYLSTLPKTRFLSPFHSKEVAAGKDLTPGEWKFYKKRWKIETVFQKLKDARGSFKLSLKGGFRLRIASALFFISLIRFNLATVKTPPKA